MAFQLPLVFSLPPSFLKHKITEGVGEPSLEAI